MARQPKQRAVHNLRSAGWQVARLTGRTLDKTVTGLFRWLTTDHSGLTRMLTLWSRMGFLDTIKFTFIYLLTGIAGIILQLVWIYLIVCYGLPLLLFGHL